MRLLPGFFPARCWTCWCGRTPLVCEAGHTSLRSWSPRPRRSGPHLHCSTAEALRCPPGKQPPDFKKQPNGLISIFQFVGREVFPPSLVGWWVTWHVSTRPVFEPAQIILSEMTPLYQSVWLHVEVRMISTCASRSRSTSLPSQTTPTTISLFQTVLDACHYWASRGEGVLLKGPMTCHQVWVWLAVTSRFENVPLLTSQVGVST